MKKKIRELTDTEMEKICEKHLKEYFNKCNYCPLQISYDRCFKYQDLDQEIEVEE